MNNEEKTLEQLNSDEAAKLEEQIYQTMFESGWLFPRTMEEVEFAEQEFGIEKASVNIKANHGNTVGRLATERGSVQTPLVLLKNRTGQRPSAIAQTLSVTVPFLSDLGPQTPLPWKRKTVAEVKRNYPQVAEEELWQSFNYLSSLPRAAFRDSVYEHEELTPEKILERSGMDSATKALWLALLEKEE